MEDLLKKRFGSFYGKSIVPLLPINQLIHSSKAVKAVKAVTVDGRLENLVKAKIPMAKKAPPHPT
jgi:hypothetical protein